MLMVPVYGYILCKLCFLGLISHVVSGFNISNLCVLCVCLDVFRCDRLRKFSVLHHLQEFLCGSLD